MSSNLATSTPASEELGPERTAADDDAVAREMNAVTLFSSWPAPVPGPSSRLHEVCAVLGLSAFFHVGLATAAFRTDHDVHGAKHVSRVEVELTRAARPPKPPIPAVVPPPAPKVVKQESKALAATPRPNVEPPVPTPLEPQNDSGSSAPAEEGGELHAGSGGLGLVPPPLVPAPVAPAPRAEPVIQAREGANYLKNPRPAYPRRAKREGWEGTTLLRIQVQASGKPSAIKVQRSSGRDVLDEAALETVAQWTFVPASQGGKPVPGSVLVPIVFRLQ